MSYRRACNHDYKVAEKSNALQYDDMGYPLRLYIYKCQKCSKTDHKWIDVDVNELKESETGESFLLKWKPVERCNKFNENGIYSR